MKKIILFSFVMVIFFSACEKNIVINVPEKAPSLVVNAWLQNGETFSVSIGKSRHILKPLDANFPDNYLVKDAQVVIFENDTAIDTLVYQQGDQRYHTAHDKKVQNGFRYKIKVTAPGFPEITAVTDVPSQSMIAGVIRQRNVRVNSYNEQMDDIFIKLDDPAAETNYYLVQFFGSAYYNTQGYFIDCVNTTDKDVEPTAYDDDPTATDNCYDGGSLLLKDVNFNGRQKSVKFSIVSDQLSEFTSNGITYRPYVKVYRITEDYLKFAKSMALFSNSSDNPFAEPVNVFSNVNKGFGIFSTYTVAVDTLR